MSEQPGDGGLGHSWFVVEVTSEPVPEGPVAVGIFRRLPYDVGTVTVGITRRIPLRFLPVVGQEVFISVGITRRLPSSIHPTEAPPEPVPSGPAGGGEQFTHGGGPLFEPIPFEQRIPAKVRIKLPRFETTATTKVAVTRRVEFTHAGSVSAVRNVEVRFGAMRESADRWGNLLREDEEILTLI